MDKASSVREFRVAVTVGDYGQALRFYRDALRLPELQSWDTPSGSGTSLDAGRATLELLSTALSALVDQAEVGKPTGARVRLALQVDDLVATAARLTALGPTVWAGRW